MRLYVNEWKRLLSNKFLFVLLVLFLVLNCMVYYYTQIREQAFIVNNKATILEMEVAYRQYSDELAYERLSNELEQFIHFRTILMAWQFPELEHLQQEVAHIVEAFPNRMKELRESMYVENSMLLHERIMLFEILVEQYHAHTNYFSYLSEITANAQKLNEVSIFQNSQSFANRNISQTVNDFDHLYAIPLETGLEQGVTSSTQYRLTDLFTIVSLFLAAALLFQYEKEKGLYKLLRATKRGRSTYIIAKLSVLLSFAVFVSLLFYISIFYIAQSIYGFGSMERYIQSMPSFFTANLLLTVKQFFWLFLVSKVMVILLIALIISMFFVWFTSISKIYTALLLFFGSSFLLYTFIHPLSTLNMFRFINVFELLDTYRLLVHYYNLSLFQYPQNRLLISYIVIVALMTLLPIAIIYRYATSYYQFTPSILTQYWQLMMSKLSFWTHSINLFTHEAHKALIQNKGFVWLALPLLLSYNYLQMSEVRFNQEDSFYNQYSEQFAGPLTDNKASQIEAEQQRFNDLPLQYTKLQEAYSNDSITLEQYNIGLAELDYFNLKKKAFAEIYASYEHLQKLQLERGIEGSFINEISSKQLFENMTRDQLNGLIYSILLIFAASLLFSYEYKNNLLPIVRSTRRGRGSLFATKYVLATIYAFILQILLYVPQYMNVIKWYPAINWQGAIQSIVAFEHVQLQLSLLSFTITIHIIQLLCTVLVTWGILSISIIARRHYFTILIATVIIIIPMLIEFLGFEQIRSYSLNVIFNLFDSFSIQGTITYYFVYILLLFTIVTGVTCIAWCLFSHSSYTWRRKQHAINDQQFNKTISSEK